MSFCPSKDIHSVYLDNELPEIYKAEYEAHIKECPKCQAELEKLKSLKKMLQSDANSITPDSHYLDQSFDRLMVKMKYSKTIAEETKSENRNFNLKYVVSIAAAAAVFALIIPLRIASVNNSNQNSAVSSAQSSMNTGFGQNVAQNVAQIQQNPVSMMTEKNNIAFDSGKSIVISGNIEESVRPAINQGKNVSNFVQEVNSRNMDAANVTKKMEVFRPDFEVNNTISIRITLPGMDSKPVYAEISLPADVITGSY